eukprot:CAMPEP_0197640580 /NCGR_PEP_ID=MMETSP1338-20131121/14824_1 /TAXON_ID=43686 ORGANISM="Pelagodinium beii, Strain RCC1491" /NCGR_SAMPLE_ID=MMETSP1338 /ASSEMBLY_ACC=CAM_ASM_000754 /LENGTH=236 /DNA_ID=CAMNT_0043213447 /DNA_START=114 /DNA_END=821 /DNA_ORIENTATION=-
MSADERAASLRRSIIRLRKERELAAERERTKQQQLVDEYKQQRREKAERKKEDRQRQLAELKEQQARRSPMENRAGPLSNIDDIDESGLPKNATTSQGAWPFTMSSTSQPQTPKRPRVPRAPRAPQPKAPPKSEAFAPDGVVPRLPALKPPSKSRKMMSLRRCQQKLVNDTAVSYYRDQMKQHLNRVRNAVEITPHASAFQKKTAFMGLAKPELEPLNSSQTAALLAEAQKDVAAL